MLLDGHHSLLRQEGNTSHRPGPTKTCRHIAQTSLFHPWSRNRYPSHSHGPAALTVQLVHTYCSCLSSPACTGSHERPETQLPVKIGAGSEAVAPLRYSAGQERTRDLQHNSNPLHVAADSTSPSNGFCPQSDQRDSNNPSVDSHDRGCSSACRA